jgi:hypothetical protein
MSTEAFDKIIPVRPPIVNKIKNPNAKKTGDLKFIIPPQIVANQLKTFIPVGIAIIIVVPIK